MCCSEECVLAHSAPGEIMATAEERLSELFEEAMRIAAVTRESDERATESLSTAEEHVKDLKRVAERAREAVALSRAMLACEKSM
jgi:hypothetical protein